MIILIHISNIASMLFQKLLMQLMNTSVEILVVDISGFQNEITSRLCTSTSVGVVLICITLPAVIVKVMCPFFAHRVLYGIRHFMVCALQIISLLVVVFAESAPPALVGVCFAFLSGGLGEFTYLGLAGHYSKLYSLPDDGHLYSRDTVATWSSGTSTATLIGGFSYAERLKIIQAESICWDGFIKEDSISVSNKISGFLNKYSFQLELITFDCKHGYDTSPRSQHKWYQVMYQVGAFVSWSSLKLVQLNITFIALLPLLQFLNMLLMILNAIYAFVPHFGVMCAIILYEGLIGGASYVNTFYHIHRKKRQRPLPFVFMSVLANISSKRMHCLQADASIREFALSTVIIFDTLGILVADRHHQLIDPRSIGCAEYLNLSNRAVHMQQIENNIMNSNDNEKGRISSLQGRFILLL
ncbi:unnamed protein product [Angiostrongylus costaricensis]|uniref:Battenin n=1 Tax=Angiostrongylus costaricensis TaxID=334426 RepID=A0A158PHB6_ANGCS|nr:unnamed protein product [Angiostrongylus costaricensis]